MYEQDYVAWRWRHDGCSWGYWVDGTRQVTGRALGWIQEVNIVTVLNKRKNWWIFIFYTQIIYYNYYNFEKSFINLPISDMVLILILIIEYINSKNKIIVLRFKVYFARLVHSSYIFNRYLNFENPLLILNCYAGVI